MKLTLFNGRWPMCASLLKVILFELLNREYKCEEEMLGFFTSIWVLIQKVVDGEREEDEVKGSGAVGSLRCDVLHPVLPEETAASGTNVSQAEVTSAQPRAQLADLSVQKWFSYKNVLIRFFVEYICMK